MTPALEKEGPVASTTSKLAPEVPKDNPKGLQKKQKGPKNHQGRGKVKANWHRPCQQGYRIPKLELSAVDSVFNMARTLMEFAAKEQARMNRTYPHKEYMRYNLLKVVLMINLLKNVRHDSITNKCDRAESKDQVQNDGIGDISISHITEQLTILRHQVLKIINNTNQFATHSAKRYSERGKFKNEITTNVEQIHKNCEPHIPRHSTPFPEVKHSFKGSLTPFLGENAISEKDIPKLEKWPTFSGEGEYNHIEFIKTIRMFQDNFHIPDEIIVGKLHSFLPELQRNGITI
ncbi:hypothetical protein O181_024608 [Austropuccinia psidii MF-1]|uniref:Uncharacterized protein n=1 Tax=Austropuccinia psidii MF-1 TaxID=1389203 RepID=A0A9Q3CJ79_9BASI|nr:hypothetical protein [Austropuccinia psidii MF-1]